MSRFRAGTNIRISAETSDYTHNYVDPDEFTVTIFKGATTVLNPTAMVQDDTGKYHYNWQSSGNLAEGKYEAIFSATRNARVSLEHDERAFYLYK